MDEWRKKHRGHLGEETRDLLNHRWHNDLMHPISGDNWCTPNHGDEESLCCYGCCCPGCLHASNAARVGYTCYKEPTGCHAYAAEWCCCMMLVPGVSCVVAPCITAEVRHRVRVRGGINENSCNRVADGHEHQCCAGFPLTDYVAHACCFPCATIQEARELRVQHTVPHHHFSKYEHSPWEVEQGGRDHEAWKEKGDQASSTSGAKATLGEEKAAEDGTHVDTSDDHHHHRKGSVSHGHHKHKPGHHDNDGTRHKHAHEHLMPHSHQGHHHHHGKKEALHSGLESFAD